MATTLFHEAGGLPSPQQMDERGIPAFPATKRLDDVEKRYAEASFPLTYAECVKLEV